MPPIPAVPPETTRQRLERLREIVKRRADPDWGIEEIEALLEQDPEHPRTHCPRYAGVVTESGDEKILASDDPAEIATEMAALAASSIPMSPVELIDLDTGESRAAILETVVWFDGEDPPSRVPRSDPVVLLAIRHSHGASYRLARDHSHARRLLEAYVAEWWEPKRTLQPDLGAMPSDRAVAVRRYLAEVTGEFADMVTLELPGGASASTVARADPAESESATSGSDAG